jgi:sulfane dehydrogenase subunit SoxC
VSLAGRAWSGTGPVRRVQLGIDGAWHDARLEDPQQPYAWQGWAAEWQAAPGEHELACRATDASGNVQPLEPPLDLSGFGNNSVQRIAVTVVRGQRAGG